MDDKIPYSKPFLTYQQQLDLLKSRGLIIKDETKAGHLLEKLGYYRFSAYWYPLLEDKEKHIFKKDAQLETAFALYCFDRKLRNLFLQELEKIEVAIRAKMIYIISGYNDAFWIENESLFPKKEGYDDVMRSVRKEYERSEDSFITAFKSKYSDDLPPSWILLEITSFGTLSKIYQNLKPGRTKREIAENFGLDDATFESWLHCLAYVRNVCAHHSRLWNRVLSIRPAKVLDPVNQWIENEHVSNKRIFYVASILVYLLDIIDPKNKFKNKLLALIEKYKYIDYNQMGFCDDWQNEPLWK